MNNATDHQDADVYPEPSFDKLLRDLHSLPKIDVPLDFQQRLKEKITVLQHIESLPWWKRFFKPAHEGGYQIPAFAYGAVATFIVLAVSVYVYQASNIEETFHPEKDDPYIPTEKFVQPQKHGREVEEPMPPTPAHTTAPEGHTQPIPPTPAQKPAVVPVKKPQQQKQTGETNTDEPLMRTRGGFDYDPEFSSPQDDTLRRLDSLRRLQMDNEPTEQPSPH